ncbi:hypothetical protein N0V88_004656 [Collariella sp. IMI 366227]|nr:hypothetical protein N0V88_004656 [Collariella sp. IMI 366227]
MAPAAAALFARQFENCTYTEDGYIDENSCYAGVIAKWSIFLGIILVVGTYLLLGYLHAQRRIQKGLPPLAYHRFLVSRATLARIDPRYRPPQTANIRPYNPDNQYLDMYAMPPPVYDPNAPRPPAYEPPVGSTKVEPDQQRDAEQSQQSQSQQPTGEHVEYPLPPGSPPPPRRSQEVYAVPPGAPPYTAQSQGTGNPNPFRG